MKQVHCVSRETPGNTLNNNLHISNKSCLSWVSNITWNDDTVPGQEAMVELETIVTRVIFFSCDYGETKEKSQIKPTHIAVLLKRWLIKLHNLNQ